MARGSRPSPTKKQKRSSSVDHSGGSAPKLASVALARAPYRPLLGQIVTETLQRFPVEGDGAVLELGAGDGQLRGLLPESLLPRVRHTDPSDSARQAFLAAHPGVDIVAATGADVAALGPLGGVLALCVLDVVPDLDAVADACAAALVPGGRLIHFLDFNAELSSAFTLLNRASLVPLPSVFGEPFTGTFPEDLFAIPSAQLDKMVGILRRSQNALAAPLRQYLAVFKAVPFNVVRAVAEYNRLNEGGGGHHGSNKEALRAAFQVVKQLATPAERAQLAQFKGQPLSSAGYFAQRLKNAFTPERGFVIEQSGVVACSRRVPWVSEKVTPGQKTPRFRTLCVGTAWQADVPPARVSLAETTLGEDEGLVELGVFTFVARRL